MTSTDVADTARPTRDRRARLGVSTIFFLNGLLAAMWVAHIPVISGRAGIDHGTLGWLLVVTGLSAFVAMQVFGRLADRFGSRGPTTVAALGLVGAVFGPAAATNLTGLTIGVVAFGFANGALDVSMNTQAVVVERAYRRPLLSSIHAYFSLGGLLGSLVVAVGLWVGAPILVTVTVVAAIGLLVTLAMYALMLPGFGPPADVDAHDDAPEPSRRSLLAKAALMAAVAFALMLAEGTAYDWSALHMVERHGSSDAVGAVAFGAFSLTMLITRFAADTLVARFGPVAVVRGGAAIATVGMVVVISAPVASVGILGWAIFGVGVAAGVPQLFSAAGNLSHASSGRVISAVVGCGYLGLLAGPAVIGFISRHTTLGVALWLAAAATAFGCAGAGVVRNRARLEG
ncbi:MFS transporter [Williamsia sterculiae]|uniref:Predicted arabinose efflux permease, MFS family n=1 Tax=Williamsia sterculiae TaxID=1344003 RepID=A0A1N7HG16_9NOCA|nr:MFS transporter [Williamsia sterculiae]SIS23681.1 Predicted arabinose efflux permease, MFS family [Williamsia sterculiae]